MAWLLANPERSSGDIFRELQRLSPGRYQPLHIRTLQRGMRKIRLACSLHSIAQKSIEHRIACNCGAFAPYFFAFWLASDLNQKGSLADAL